MSKYDFEIDLSENTSTGIILGDIREGSVVLEFGCATGRMTRYMKEQLSCRVYIVEYEQKAFDVAVQYAEDGLCDDIMTFRWAEKFRDIRFDAIIFADVLEHLSAPEKVLERAAALLKEDGCLYVSVPNITHNDILLKAYEERFDYTATGILDDTHVHFWGLHNIEALSGRCGLWIRKIQTTFCPTGYTEQYGGEGRERNLLLENILQERACGEAYQFVVTFGKDPEVKTVYRQKVPSVTSHIYLDTGSGFSPEQIESIVSERTDRGTYCAHYVIEKMENLKQIRFDPLEEQGCIVLDIAIRQGEDTLSAVYPNGVPMEKGMYLPGGDPMVCAAVIRQDMPVVLDVEFVIPGNTYLKLMEAGCEGQPRLLAQIEMLKNESSFLRRAVSDATRQKRDVQESRDILAAENEELRRSIGAYVMLVNRKEQYILELEANQRRGNVYWKRLRSFMGRALRAVKRRVKRLLGRG